MLKTIYEEAIRKAEIERDRQAAAVRDRVMRETIAPYNQEVDSYLEKAIAELTKNHNSSISAMNEQFAVEKKKMIDAAEEKKRVNSESVISCEVAVVTAEYDNAIANLRKQMESIKE
jgi:hypothetical protein